MSMTLKYTKIVSDSCSTIEDFRWKMKSISIVVSLILVSSIMFACSKQKTQENNQNNYNIVLIVSDSLRFDVIGTNGGEAKTPNIDWLTKNGTSFVNAHSTSPRTLPSSVGMLTGNNPGGYPFISKQKARDYYIVPESEYLLAEALTDAGYKSTAYVNNPYSYVSNNLQGFTLVKDIGRITDEQINNLAKITTRIRNYPPYQKIYLYIDYLLNLNSDQKFFSLMWIDDPHAPYTPLADYESKIIVDRKKLSEPYEKYTWYNSESRRLSKYEQNYTKALYVKEVESMDERVGLIVRALKQHNLFDRTIIVFTADHGEHFGEHGIAGHGGSYFEELLHVPLIFSGAGIPKNKKIMQSVSNVDLTATLEDLLRVGHVISANNKSFADLFKSKEVASEPQYFIGTRLDYQKYVDAAMWNNYKLINLKDGAHLLFDIANDPAEKDNLFNKQPEVGKSLLAIIGVFRGKNKKRIGKLSGEAETIRPVHGKNEKEMVKRLKSLGYIH